MRRNIFIFSLALASLVGVSGMLQAQNTNASSTNLPSTNMPPRVQSLPPRQAGPLAILSDEQRASYRNLSAAQHEQIAELQTKLLGVQGELLELTLLTNANEKLIREKAADAGRIYADSVVLQAKLFAEIQPPLSAEQIEKIKAVMSPRATPRVLRGQPSPASTNRDENGLPPKQ